MIASHNPDVAVESASENSRWLLWFGAVLALAAILFFARLGARALWSSEFRWAEIAREMRVTGNYFWPTINGNVYYDKPLGTYWLVLAATWVTGSLDETAARLPCAVAGVMAVAFLILLVRRLYDSRVGLLSGFILATSLSFVFFSRHASADVETVAGELAALLLFSRNEAQRGGWWVVGLWMVMAITSLTKGLLGFVLPLLIIGTYSCLKPGWSELGGRMLKGRLMERLRWLFDQNRWLFNWWSIPAIALGLGIYVTPFSISQHLAGSQKGLEMVYRENVVRFFHPFDHRGPIYLYVYVIFALMAPWAALLPGALFETHHIRNQNEDPARPDRFALAFFWATFVFYTLSGSRRSYYILPIFPAAAILIARTLMRPMTVLSTWSKRLLIAGFAVIAILTVGGFIVLVPPAMYMPGKLASLPLAPSRIAYAILWAISLVGVIYAVRNLTTKRIAIAVSIVAYALNAYLYIFAMPGAERYRGEKPFGFEVNRILGGDTSKLALYKTNGPLFYLNPPEPLADYADAKAIEQAAKTGQVQWIIVRRRDLPELKFPVKTEASEAIFPWEADSEGHNKVVLLRIGG